MITSVVCLIIILSLFISSMSQSIAVGPTVIATIRCDPENMVQVAQVGPGDEGVVIFTGEVNVDMVAGGDQKIIIYLTATSSHGWPTIVNPPRITFSQNTDTEIPFRVVVIVPPNISCYINDTITVSGDATVFPNEYCDKLQPINMTVKIEQYHGSILKIKNSVQKVCKEEKVVYTLNITNTGNGQDIYNIYVNNLKEQENAGLDIILPNEINLRANETKDIDIIIRTSKNTQPGKYYIELSVRSILEEQNDSFTVLDNITFTLEVEPDYFIPVIIGIIIILFLIILAFFRIKRRKRVK